MALELVEDNDNSFKVKRDDGVVVHIAKTPETAHIYKLCKGGMAMASDGGKVAGKAKVAGDSKKNDTVDAKVSPGEIIVPRATVAKGEKAIAQFIQESLSGKHPARGSNHFGGGLEGMDNPYQATTDTAVAQQVPTPAPFVGDDPNGTRNPPPPPTMPTPQGATGSYAPAPVLHGATGSYAPPPAPFDTPIPADAGANPPVLPTGPQDATSADNRLKQESTTHGYEANTAEQRDVLNKVNSSIADAVKAKADADTMKSNLDMAQHTAEANIAQENNLKMQAFDADRAKEIQDRMTKIKNVESQFSGMTIDGGRFFGDGLTGSKVMAGIGLALGALGQGFTGKDYGVNDVIEKAIDRDIEVQKANVAKVGKEVDLARGGLKDYLAVTNDMGTAMAAEKARLLDAVAKQFAAIADGNSSAAIKSASAQQQAAYQIEAAKLNLQVGKNTGSDVVQKMPMKLDPVPEKVNEEVNKNVAAAANLGRIRQLKAVAGTGNIEGRIENLKNYFGLQNADNAEFTQRLKENLIGMIHETGGSRGFSDTERPFFEKATLNNILNDEAFDRLLENRQKEIDGALNVTQHSAAENRQYPIDIAGRKAAYASSSPQFSDQYFKSYNFKKAGGK